MYVIGVMEWLEEINYVKQDIVTFYITFSQCNVVIIVEISSMLKKLSHDISTGVSFPPNHGLHKPWSLFVSLIGNLE